ncbi:CZB domain-containing protein [Accumulibacter sp.]|nr:CZB domain-containing protein [Accumulibacter sp.]HRF04474.1 CZB domain-containing protein [Accumulibacter sp.]
MADIEKAIGNHALWMSHLRDAIVQAHPSVDVAEVRAEDQCEFGKWLYDPCLSVEDRASSVYQDVKRLHADFHRLAARVIELAASGRPLDAYALLYGEYITMSGRLAIAMRAWQDRLKGSS